MVIGYCGEEDCDWLGDSPYWDDESELYCCPYCMVECWTFETWKEAEDFARRSSLSEGGLQ